MQNFLAAARISLEGNTVKAVSIFDLTTKLDFSILVAIKRLRKTSDTHIHDLFLHRIRAFDFYTAVP